MKNPTALPAWKKLQQHCQQAKGMHMRDMFDSDKDRFKRFSVRLDDMLVDYSKNRITPDTMNLLLDLAEEADIPGAIGDMFAGKPINNTENRAVLHVALRNAAKSHVTYDGVNVKPAIDKVLKQMEEFSYKVQHGQWRGATGQRITDVVNIGIGGSDLGPRMAVEALKHYRQNVRVHFVSNVDGTEITEVIERLDPASTLFVISSKSWTTQETMMNALTARCWITDILGPQAIEKHFVALSTNARGVSEFGIDTDNMFEFWDWAGGRYSLWSAIGLPIAISIGFDNFRQLLNGAYAMDTHFLNAPLSENIPVILGLIGVWNTNFLDIRSHAVLPYDQYLHRLPAYLQQADMESNGKSVDRGGKRVKYSTGQVLFGEPGTNGQHSFYQLLHQGTEIISSDFIASAWSFNEAGLHHPVLLSNFIAQPEALMRGKTADEAKDQGCPDNLVPYKVFEGNRPSTSILFDRMTPFNLGKLIAMYEHKIFVQGMLWNINSYDQWGVQLGKELATVVCEQIMSDAALGHDSSTNAMIEEIRHRRA
ncbi:MAG: glucose-6-phosphate isomerase [Alphaproteobacteria bacterium]|nr:glucose-6-phosphate isomerase [Alphaproteobacteria bacterium]